MIVRNLDFECIVTAPYKTDPVLVVDANTVLPLPITVKLFEVVAGWMFEIVQLLGTVQHGQLPPGDIGWGRSAGLAGLPDLRRLPIGESPDHRGIVTLSVNNVNRY